MYKIESPLSVSVAIFYFESRHFYITVPVLLYTYCASNIFSLKAFSVKTKFETFKTLARKIQNKKNGIVQTKRSGGFANKP